jgi:predicted ABC-type ATPase
MASRKSVTPSLWLIAGPNGSGKSSLYGSDQNAIYGDTNIADSAHSFWIINPDLLTLRIRSVEQKSPEEANLAAVQRIEAWLKASIDAHQSVGVETVLSNGQIPFIGISRKTALFRDSAGVRRPSKSGTQHKARPNAG